jgi:hypothetical protein
MFKQKLIYILIKLNFTYLRKYFDKIIKESSINKLKAELPSLINKVLNRINPFIRSTTKPHCIKTILF